MIKPMLAAVVILLSAGTVAGEVYQWVDESGAITYKDYPPPAAKTKKARKVKVYGEDEFQSSPPPAPETPAARRERKANRAPAKAEKKAAYAEIFTTDWCPYCKKAVEYLRDKGINFTQYDIEKDSTAAQRKKELDKRPGVPFALINGRPVHGFSPEAYERALEEK